MSTSTRQATAAELAAVGWTTDGRQWRCPASGAWYVAGELIVGEYRTNLDGERERGPCLYITSDNPLSERYCARLGAGNEG